LYCSMFIALLNSPPAPVLKSQHLRYRVLPQQMEEAGNQDLESSPRRSTNRLTYFINTTTSWRNWRWLWMRSLVLQHLKHTRAALPSTSRGYSTTSRLSEPAHQSIQQSAQISDARLSLPDKYDGTSSKCRGFLLQCSLYFAHQMGAPPPRSPRLPWLFLC
jgi:hypothetical protein